MAEDVRAGIAGAHPRLTASVEHDLAVRIFDHICHASPQHGWDQPTRDNVSVAPMGNNLFQLRYVSMK